MDGTKCTFICTDPRPCPAPIPRVRWWPGVGGGGGGGRPARALARVFPHPTPMLGFSRPGGSGRSSSLLPGLLASSSPLPQPAVTGLPVN